MRRANESSRFRRWRRFMSSRQRKASAPSRTAVVTANPVLRIIPKEALKEIRKEIHRPETLRQGREDRGDAKTSARACEGLGARLRDRRCAVDSRGLGGASDDLFSLSVQFGAGVGRQ